MNLSGSLGESGLSQSDRTHSVFVVTLGDLSIFDHANPDGVIDSRKLHLIRCEN